MDVISLPIELDNEKIDGRFRLANIVIQRANELVHGAKPKTETSSKSITTIALEEALSGEIEYITGEEAIKASELAKKLDYRKFLEEKRKKTTKEHITEFEKDLEFYLNEKEGIDKDSFEKLFTEDKKE